MATITDGLTTSDATVVAQGGTDGALLVTSPGNSSVGAVIGLGNSAAPASVLLTEDDAGSITLARRTGSPQTSQNRRLNVGLDTMLFCDTFNATAQNTSLWSYTFNTLTAAQPGAGSVNFSTVQGTTSAHGAFMRTFQYFPLWGKAPTYFIFHGGQTAAPLVANEVVTFGIGLPTAATTPPTDGVDFTLTTAGLIGNIRYNGVTTSTGVLRTLAQIVVANVYKFAIHVGERQVTFWMDQVLLGSITIPAGNGQPMQQASLPLFLMKYNTGAVANTNTFRFFDVAAVQGDLNTSKPWAQQLGILGQHSAIGQNGGTMGSTANNFGQGALTATGAATNTALPAGHSAGIGGIYTLTAQVTNVGAAGDMIVSSFQNPAPTINITGRNLVITGISIDCVNTGATVATTPTTLVWGAAWGHTAVSLATAETASFATATTHAPRRMPLGMNSVAIAAVVGTPLTPSIACKLDTPIVVRPGEFFATTARFLVGTATASQSIVCIIGVDGYWE